MKKTRTNDVLHKCEYCGDLFLSSRNYIWNCSDICRLMSCFDKKGDCWICRRKNKQRYGTFKYRNKNMGTHRASYLIFKGEIPNGMEVCHTCDVRQCINPEHLFLGTKKENMVDCLKKGRMSLGGKHYIAKITEEQVREIREMKENKPWLSYRQIGELFGLTWGAVYDICKRRTWKHIE